MKKVLIFERMNEVEVVLSSYLDSFPGAEFKYIFRIDSATQEEIIAGLMWCDTIAFQSIFETNLEDGMKSFRNMIDLFWAKPEFRKPVHIIHTTGKLLEVFNFKLDSDAWSKAAIMISHGLDVFNVYYKAYADPTDDGKGMFRKPNIYKFAPVKLWYCKEHTSIWDEYAHYLPNLNTTHNLYRYEPKFVEPSENKYTNLSEPDLKTLGRLLTDDIMRLHDLNKDLDGPLKNVIDKEEKKKIKRERKQIFVLLDKLGISDPRK